MNISKIINLENGIWFAQIGLDGGPEMGGLTPRELEAVKHFGDPLVEVGGTFTGFGSRANVVAPTLTVTGDGAGATLSVDRIENGVITQVSVAAGGSGYSSTGVTVTAGTGGSGASFSLTLTGDVVTGVTIDDGGSGYFSPTPYLNFELAANQRRLVADFPFRYRESVEDYFDADAMVRFWADTVQNRMAAAKDTILEKLKQYPSKTVTTV
jgi:hypothetical protein